MTSLRCYCCTLCVFISLCPSLSCTCRSSVLVSNTELSLLESSRLSANGKRPRDRNALRVAVRIRPLIEREKGSRAVTCDGGNGRMVVVNPIKFKASADAVSSPAILYRAVATVTGCQQRLRPLDYYSSPLHSASIATLTLTVPSAASMFPPFPAAEHHGRRLIPNVHRRYCR